LKWVETEKLWECGEEKAWQLADRRKRRRREEGEDKKSRKKIKRGGEEKETENYIAGCFQLIIAATEGRTTEPTLVLELKFRNTKMTAINKQTFHDRSK
jgi:hypothetical protein